MVSFLFYKADHTTKDYYVTPAADLQLALRKRAEQLIHTGAKDKS